MDEKSRIKSEAIRFRKAILKSRGKLPTTFKSFPIGTCGDASILLANHLTDSGLGKFLYVLGRENDQYHAWLEKGNLIIDITADQFGDRAEEVIVTTNRSFHNQFEIQDSHECNLEKYNQNIRKILNDALSLIKENL